jgi:hypothetical protein
MKNIYTLHIPDSSGCKPHPNTRASPLTSQPLGH